MLPIYAGLPHNLELIAQKILNEIIEDYMESHKDIETDYSDLFPEIIYSTKREKGDKAVNEVCLWSRDEFNRRLSPLHEHALYNILMQASHLEKDFKIENGQSLYFRDIPKKENKDPEDENEDWELTDLGDINFYLESCFEDYDFLSVPQLLNMLDSIPLEAIENQLGIDLKSYIDLVPPDIEGKLDELSEDIKQAVKQKDSIEYDVFLSHSSLDKEIYVSNLSNKLEQKGLKVFEDVKIFKSGHSQTNMINVGIHQSRFVVLFLSLNFIKSGWSQYEFKSFLNREINEKRVIILPIWHNVTFEDFQSYNPYLADKFALDTSKYTMDEVVESIYQVIEESRLDN